jgi:hypothetical protein
VVELDPKNGGAKKQLRDLRAAGFGTKRTKQNKKAAAAFAKTEPDDSAAEDTKKEKKDAEEDTAEEIGAEFKTGDFVEAQWKEPGEYPGWHGASIAAVDMSNSSEAVYSIHYDDGGRWNKCPAHMVRSAPIDVIEKKKKQQQRREVSGPQSRSPFALLC